MPGRNVLKKYRKNRYYHIYNRGVNKQQIVFSDDDFAKFLKFLEEAVNRYNIELINYVILKNHFHLLIKQVNSRDIEKLMRSLCTRYVLYVNNRYNRVGCLFQGPYRARLLKDELDLISVSRYIDRHFDLKDSLGETLFNY